MSNPIYKDFNMYLKNPLFRSLLRYVIAGEMEDMKKAYRLVFSEFGKDTEKAAEAIWRGKDIPPYDAIGYERIGKKTIENIFDTLDHRNTGTTKTTIRKRLITDVLDYIARGSSLHMTDLGAPTKLDINKIPIFKTILREKLHKRYQGIPGTVNEVHSVLNKAMIDQELRGILANPNMYSRIMGEGLQTLPPGSPQSKLSSEYVNILPMNLRVVLKYIDSFEN